MYIYLYSRCAYGLLVHIYLIINICIEHQMNFNYLPLALMKFLQHFVAVFFFFSYFYFSGIRTRCQLEKWAEGGGGKWCCCGPNRNALRTVLN